jgi:hypothetical protein
LLHADDQDRLEKSIPSDFWRAFGEHRRLVAVGRDSTLIIGKDGRIYADEAGDLVGLGFDLLRLFRSPAERGGTRRGGPS